MPHLKEPAFASQIQEYLYLIGWDATSNTQLFPRIYRNTSVICYFAVLDIPHMLCVSRCGASLDLEPFMHDLIRHSLDP